MTLAWTAHPARSRPHHLALVVAVLLFTTGAVMLSFESLLLTAIAVVIVVVSVSSFLFPTHYQLSDRGLEERRFGIKRSRRWEDLRRLQVGPEAALVSPFARKTWLDRHRGFVVLFDGGDRAAVIGELKRRVEGPRGQ